MIHVWEMYMSAPKITQDNAVRKVAVQHAQDDVWRMLSHRVGNTVIPIRMLARDSMYWTKPRYIRYEPNA